jgi:hypothetical protein
MRLKWLGRMKEYAVDAEANRLPVRGYGVKVVSDMAELRAAIRRADKAIQPGNRAVYGFFVALKEIWRLPQKWTRPFTRYWLQTKGMPDNLVNLWDFVEEDTKYYLVPKPQSLLNDPYGINRGNPGDLQ